MLKDSALASPKMYNWYSPSLLRILGASILLYSKQTNSNLPARNQTSSCVLLVEGQERYCCNVLSTNNNIFIEVNGNLWVQYSGLHLCCMEDCSIPEVNQDYLQILPRCSFLDTQSLGPIRLDKDSGLDEGVYKVVSVQIDLKNTYSSMIHCYYHDSHNPLYIVL